jgi:hypothetical protein
LSIAEYFVEEDHVRVNLETGGGDLNAFRSLMPDGIYEQMGHAPRLLQERLGEFLESIGSLVFETAGSRSEQGDFFDAMERNRRRLMNLAAYP